MNYWETHVSDELEEETSKRLWRNRQRELRGVIAFKGLPSSSKTVVAMMLGECLRCPVLCIQDFFDQEQSGTDEIERAFTRLCKEVKRLLLRLRNLAVIIKTRLTTDFEIRELVELLSSVNIDTGQEYPLLIIDVRFGNISRWRDLFNGYAPDSKFGKMEKDNEWYRPRIWTEMDKAIRDYYHPQSQAHWDQHLKQALQSTPKNSPCVTRLVVDAWDDLASAPTGIYDALPDDFLWAIQYLQATPNQNPYMVVNYSVLRPFLFEQRWSALALKGRRQSLCPRGGCVFQLLEDVGEEANSESLICGVCDQQVLSGTPAYTCRLCILASHKSCAERIHFEPLRSAHLSKEYYTCLLSKKHACRPCADAQKHFSRDCGTCVYQTHLKCGPLPTIINHPSHPHHFLSLLLVKQHFYCRACQGTTTDYRYCCRKCGVCYHLECAMSPLELKHEHGGYEHVMELKYSHSPDALNDKEDCWCDFCYKNISPRCWFYACKHCAYYAAHLRCTSAFQAFHNPQDCKFVQQIQSQLEEATAEEEAAHSEHEAPSDLCKFVQQIQSQLEEAFKPFSEWF